MLRNAPLPARGEESARHPVYDVAVESPLDYAPILSERLGRLVWLKREDLQPIFSFKLRGAYCLMAGLSAAELQRGVIAASAGNHAQGVALAAKRLGTHALIVVPRTISPIKAAAIERFGAELVRYGDEYEEACEYAKELAGETGRVFVHPYDDPRVIAGQGTIAHEILAQHSGHIDAVFVPVGGGGLIAGVAQAIKAARPGTKVFGVEPEGSDAMNQALLAGRPIELPHVSGLADGVAVRKVGDHTFRICRELVDGILVVSDDEICAAVKEVFEDCRAVLEPSGALSYAGLRRYVEANSDVGSLIAICSGANLNFDRLRFIAERAEVGEQREALYVLRIPERKGEFRRLCQAIGDRSVTEFKYRMSDPAMATVLVGVKVTSAQERGAFGRQLGSLYEVHDVTEHELAKTHLRYMCGGPSTVVESERLFEFDFPERAGALASFLECLGATWNVSLFHYRNAGSDRGKVLVGFEVPAETESAFQHFRAQTGYPSREVTDSLAAGLLLGGNQERV